MIDVGIKGRNKQSGAERQALVGDDNSLRVEVHPGDPPDIGMPSRFQYFNKLLGSTGAGSGTTNMTVDGSVTAQEFFIDSSEDYDVRLTRLVVFLADASGNVSHGDFGGIAALGTGWDLKVEEAGVETFIIEKATTGGEIILQSGTDFGYGNTTTTWELTDFSTNADGTLVSIPIGEAVPGGLRIGRGTQDRLVSVVNDDLSSGMSQFTVRAIGYRHFP